MAEWTIETVADRFIEAARTAHRLPPVRVQGYFNCWPAIKRMPWENLGAEPPVYRFPPDPAAIDRMLETCGGSSGLRRNSDTWSGCGRSGTRGKKSAAASPVIEPLPGVVGRRHWRSWSSSCKRRSDMARSPIHADVACSCEPLQSNSESCGTLRVLTPFRRATSGGFFASITANLASEVRLKATAQSVAFVVSSPLWPRPIATGPSWPKTNAGGASAALF